MPKRIIYQTNESGVAVIIPAGKFLSKKLQLKTFQLVLNIKSLTQSLLSKNTVVCYDKIKDVVVKINIDIFNKEKNIRYITTRTNEYKLIKQNKENLCQVA